MTVRNCFASPQTDIKNAFPGTTPKELSAIPYHFAAHDGESVFAVLVGSLGTARVGGRDVGSDGIAAFVVVGRGRWHKLRAAQRDRILVDRVVGRHWRGSLFFVSRLENER